MKFEITIIIIIFLFLKKKKKSKVKTIILSHFLVVVFLVVRNVGKIERKKK